MQTGKTTVRSRKCTFGGLVADLLFMDPLLSAFTPARPCILSFFCNNISRLYSKNATP